MLSFAKPVKQTVCLVLAVCFITQPIKIDNSRRTVIAL